MTARRHAFVRWLVARYGTEIDTPLGKFSRELNRSGDFPRTGDHAVLHEYVQMAWATDSWTQTCFEVAWERWQARTCGMADCTGRPVGGESLLCPEHELAALL